MNFLEKELEDWFFEHPEAFHIPVEWKRRQLRLPSGIADVVGIASDPDSHLFEDVILVELKAVQLKSQDICQVIRYRADIEKGVQHYRSVHAFLIGTGEVPNHLIFEAKAANVTIVTVEPGFKLSGSGWSFTNEFVSEHDEMLADNEWFNEIVDESECRMEKSMKSRKERRARLNQQFYSELVNNWEAANG